MCGYGEEEKGMGWMEEDAKSGAKFLYESFTRGGLCRDNVQTMWCWQHSQMHTTILHLYCSPPVSESRSNR